MLPTFFNSFLNSVKVSAVIGYGLLGSVLATTFFHTVASLKGYNFCSSALITLTLVTILSIPGPASSLHIVYIPGNKAPTGIA